MSMSKNSHKNIIIIIIIWLHLLKKTTEACCINGLD